MFVEIVHHSTSIYKNSVGGGNTNSLLYYVDTTKLDGYLHQFMQVIVSKSSACSIYSYFSVI
jgi:hypothetical protein